jgi:hypothetical protein
VVATLGIARAHILKLTSAITERAVALQAGLKARFARKGSDHAPGA